MKDYRFSHSFAYYSFLVILCIAISLAPFGCKKDSEEQVFELDEVSAFEAPENMHFNLAIGQAVECDELPDPNVRKYPSF